MQTGPKNSKPIVSFLNLNWQTSSASEIMFAGLS